MTSDEVQEQQEPVQIVLAVRDVNLLCREFGNVYALVAGETHRRKIHRARRWQGVLEIRTAARDEWRGPVVWIEWLNPRLGLLRYQEQEIR